MSKRTLTLIPAPREAKRQVHSLLEAELQDIRRCLSRLEEELQDGPVEFPQPHGNDTRAA
ncbi:MAG: hypothetical protein ACXVZV_10725 [Terriglobales bacterium]